MFLILIISFFFSFSVYANPSFEKINQVITSVENEFQKIPKRSSANTMGKRFDGIYRKLRDLKMQDYDLSSIPADQYEKLKKRISSLRFQIAQKGKKTRRKLSPDNYEAYKAALRATRYLEEGIAACDPSAKTLENPYAAGSPNIVTPDGKPFDFAKDLQAGDVLFMSGGSAISKIIPRSATDGSKVDKTQFSHQAMIAERDGKKYVVETLIETGPIYTELNEYLSKHKDITRLGVTRMSSQYGGKIVGKKAGLEAMKIADKHRTFMEKGQREKSPYHYGFTDKTLHCSKYIEQAFARTGTPVKLPTYESVFNPINPSLVGDRLMIPKGYKMGVPGHIEGQRHFKNIAEYRNPLKTKENFWGHLIMDRIMKKIDQGYDLRGTNWSRVADKVKNNLPDGFKDYIGSHKPNLSTELPPKAIETMIALKKLDDIVMAKLKSKLYKNRGGSSLSFGKEKKTQKLTCEKPPGIEEIYKAVDEILDSSARVALHLIPKGQGRAGTYGTVGKKIFQKIPGFR